MNVDHDIAVAKASMWGGCTGRGKGCLAWVGDSGFTGMLWGYLLLTAWSCVLKIMN